MNVIVILWVGSTLLSPEVIIAGICRLSLGPGRWGECATVMRDYSDWACLPLLIARGGLRFRIFCLFSDICWLTVVTDTSSCIKSYQQGVRKPFHTWIFNPCVCFTSYSCLNSETIDCNSLAESSEVNQSDCLHTHCNLPRGSGYVRTG